MIFIELVLQNFGPYVGRQVIDLRPHNGDVPKPIILLGGMNGGGKTTLMDAIRLALYGNRAQCSTRGSLSYGDFLSQSASKNTPPTEETAIELIFEYVLNHQNVTFHIQRQWNRHSKKDELAISTDPWVDDSLSKTWEELIEGFFPLGISNLFLFDGEQVKELADLDAPPLAVVEAIQSLLGLELSERLSVDLDVLKTRKMKMLAGTKELEELKALEDRLHEKEAELARVKSKISSLMTDRDRKEDKKDKADRQFRSEGGKIAGERSQLELQLKQTEAKIDDRRQNLSQLAAGMLPLVLVKPLLQAAREQGKIERRYQQAANAKEIVLDRDRSLLDYLKTLQLPETKVEKIAIFLETENQKLALDSAEKTWLNADDDTLDRLSNLLDYQLDDRLSQAQAERQKLQDLEEELATIERQLGQAASPERYRQLADEVARSQSEFIAVKTELETAENRRDTLTREIEIAKKELSRYSEENIGRENTHHLIESLDRVQATLKLFRERLTLRKLNKLEIEVGECFRYLLHKGDLVHRVAIDTDTFRLTLYDPEGQVVPKHRLSAGEKQLLAIAFLWGLARVSGRNLPIAIDTPLGRLDSSHRQNLIERYFPSASHQVILLSTDTEVGEVEVANLREQEAIAREYLLDYDEKKRQTTVKPGYFQFSS